jgi:hypothetical protein
MQPFRDGDVSESDLNSVQESRSNRVAGCVTIDPETEIETSVSQDIVAHGRTELSCPPYPDYVDPAATLVRSCCAGLARQPSGEPHGAQPSVLMSEIVCTTMSEKELQEIDVVAPVESDNFTNDQLPSESLSRGRPLLIIWRLDFSRNNLIRP